MILYYNMGDNKPLTDHKRILMLIVAWGIIPLGYLSWCLSTISYKADLYMYMACLTWVTTILVYTYVSKQIAKEYRDLDKQFVLIDFGLLASCMIWAIFTPVEFEKKFWIYLYLALGISIVILVYDLLRKRDMLPRKAIKWFKAHGFLIVLLLIELILCYDPDMYQFKWDGLLYYVAVSGSNLGSISSVSLYGHMAQTSGVLYRIGALICHDTGYGMILANMLALLIGALAFYGSVKELIPNRSNLEYTMFTACFAFSPFTLGMVNYFSTDYFCVCLINVLIYFVLKGKWGLTVPAACLFVFTKEPALIAYSGLCLGLVIKDIIIANGKLKDKLMSVMSKVHYYFMLLPFVIWFATYRVLGKWSAGNGGLGFDVKYMVNKLKVFLILNFNWIVTLAILTGIIILILKKRKNVIVELFPLIICNVALLVFNCVYITANHARYVDSFVSVNLMIGLAIFNKIMSDKNRVMAIRCAVVCYIFVLLISCFVTIDPVSKAIFRCERIGEKYILSTGTTMLGDSSIYNKQMLWLENTFSKAVEDSIEEHTDVYISIADDSIYAIDGMSRSILYNDTQCSDTQYWDDTKHRRISYAELLGKEKEIKKYKVHYLPNDKTQIIDTDIKKISIIYIPDINDYMKPDGYEAVESKEYKYRGWTIKRDILIKEQAE